MALGEERDESGGEGALGKQAAEKIGQALRHEIGVGDGTGAKRGSDEDIADKAQHTA